MESSNNIYDNNFENKPDKQFEIYNCNEYFFLEKTDEFVDLCKRSFAEHIERNVRMGPGYMTKDKWIQLSKKCVGQYMVDSGRIIAFWLLYPDYNKKEVYGKILAVDPKYKGHHLGLTLSLARAEYLRELGMNVFITDTSLKAPHVVKFHKRYGCKAIGMASWPNTNYYSVILREALTPEYEISDMEARKRFLISKIKCKILFREDGTSTLLGKMYSFFNHYYTDLYNKFVESRHRSTKSEE